jgi:hypothetical protein
MLQRGSVGTGLASASRDALTARRRKREAFPVRRKRVFLRDAHGTEKPRCSGEFFFTLNPADQCRRLLASGCLTFTGPGAIAAVVLEIFRFTKHPYLYF